MSLLKVEIFDSRTGLNAVPLPEISLCANKNLTRVITTLKKS